MQAASHGTNNTRSDGHCHVIMNYLFTYVHSVRPFRN